MPSEVRHQVDGGHPYPLVRLAGVLDAATTPPVRAGLLEVLATQPEAIVVDVRELTIGDPSAVNVLPVLAREAADWPGCHVVLSAGPQGTAWRATGLPVCPTPGDAFAALGTPDPRRFLGASLEPAIGAARHSRELVTEACGRWDLPDLAGPACIVVTEMVNNVVAHARTPMTVMLALHGETMSVAVRDQSTRIPEFTGSPVPVTAYGGRGLLLIDSVASRWGSLVLPGGKVVWAALEPGEQAMNQVPSTGLTGRLRG
jgi:hypothetical protein